MKEEREEKLTRECQIKSKTNPPNQKPINTSKKLVPEANGLKQLPHLLPKNPKKENLKQSEKEGREKLTNLIQIHFIMSIMKI